MQLCYRQHTEKSKGHAEKLVNFFSIYPWEFSHMYSSIFLFQVRSKSELNKVLDDYNVGDEVLLQIRRGSETVELPLVLEETA